MPGMPNGKPAGVRCLHLTKDERCALFGHPDRPDFCQSLKPQPEMCGSCRSEAMTILERLERDTRPERERGPCSSGQV